MKPVLTFIFLGTVASGCAARSLPATFPDGSAASLVTPEARRHAVLTTLRSDPPLPGEPASGWAGLEDTANDVGPQPQGKAEAATTADGPRSSKAPDQAPQQHGH